MSDESVSKPNVSQAVVKNQIIINTTPVVEQTAEVATATKKQL